MAALIGAISGPKVPFTGRSTGAGSLQREYGDQRPAERWGATAKRTAATSDGRSPFAHRIDPQWTAEEPRRRSREIDRCRGAPPARWSCRPSQHHRDEYEKWSRSASGARRSNREGSTAWRTGGVPNPAGAPVSCKRSNDGNFRSSRASTARAGNISHGVARKPKACKGREDERRHR